MTRTAAEELACRIAQMGRSDLIALLRSADRAFELDFTEEFLNALPIERLRHIVLACKLHRDKA